MPPARIALYAGPVGLAAASTYSTIARPLPHLWSLVAVLFVYLAFLVLGAVVLRWRVFADAVLTGPRGARGVALTFDDGPDHESTRRILSLLAERRVRATFFVIGKKAESNPDLVRAIVAQGHDLGLHSYAHDRLFALRRERYVRGDLERAISVVEQITGRRPAFFRPPIGHTNPVIAKVARELGLVVVGWSVAGWDGLPGAHADAVARRVGRGLRDGAIVLLHDAHERSDGEPPAVRALPAVLDTMAAIGLESVPLSSWLGEPPLGVDQPRALGSVT